MSGATAGDARPAHQRHQEHLAAVRTLLIVRDAPPRPQLGMAAATAIAEVMENALGRPCAIAWPWDVGLRAGDGFARLCRVSIELDEGQAVALIGLRFALARLWGARRVARAEGEAPSAPLFSNEHWREILLARALHTLDTRLRALMAEPSIPAESAERAALAREWRRRVMAPRRVVIVCADGSRATGVGAQIAPDGALLTRSVSNATPDATPRRFALDDVTQAWGAGWGSAWAPAHTVE